MKKIALSLLLALGCMSDTFAIRQGTSISINPGDIPVNTNTPTVVSLSTWKVWFTRSALYKYQMAATSALIARTNNSYTVRISAFNKPFTYTQVSVGELNLTKTEYVSLSKTSRLVLTWYISTDGDKANITCDVESQSLVKNVWKTNVAKSTWLRTWVVVADMN